jgi:hypothetical protein
MTALKQSPIQVVIPGHAIMCFYSEQQIAKYFDHYSPYIKEYDKPFVQAMKYVITPKQMIQTLDEQEVRGLQALEGYKDAPGVTHWTGKSLKDYMRVRFADKKGEMDSVFTVAAKDPVLSLDDAYKPPLE